LFRLVLNENSKPFNYETNTTFISGWLVALLIHRIWNQQHNNRSYQLHHNYVRLVVIFSYLIKQELSFQVQMDNLISYMSNSMVRMSTELQNCVTKLLILVLIIALMYDSFGAIIQIENTPVKGARKSNKDTGQLLLSR
jgi:hypothetical protein